MDERRFPVLLQDAFPDGEMAEWLKAHAWKACVLERVPRVRIPVSPPFKLHSLRESLTPGEIVKRVPFQGNLIAHCCSRHLSRGPQSHPTRRVLCKCHRRRIRTIRLLRHRLLTFRDGTIRLDQAVNRVRLGTVSLPRKESRNEKQDGAGTRIWCPVSFICLGSGFRFSGLFLGNHLRHGRARVATEAAMRGVVHPVLMRLKPTDIFPAALLLYRLSMTEPAAACGCDGNGLPLV
jgi:hypothetical protein